MILIKGVCDENISMAQSKYNERESNVTYLAFFLGFRGHHGALFGLDLCLKVADGLFQGVHRHGL